MILRMIIYKESKIIKMKNSNKKKVSNKKKRKFRKWKMNY